MNSVEKLAQILGTPAQELLEVDTKMSAVSGKTGVLEAVVADNDQNIDRVLADLGMSRESSAEDVYDALTQKLMNIDKKLFELLGRPDLSKLSNDAGKIRETALGIFTPPKGFFIKKEKVAELLEKDPPQSLLDHFGYKNVAELIEKEGFASVVAALRFTQTTEWMHQFFDVAYAGLKPEDFEDRDVEIKVMDTKWLSIAEKFIGKKFHNVSHLKEYGVIFISPDPIDVAGETLRMFLLVLHYLHEVPFYSNLFRKFLHDTDFIPKLQSLLRGDVSEGPTHQSQNISWRIVQRYLAKDDPNDFRLHERHVDPEAQHWYLVAHNFQKLAEVMGDTDEKFNISYWTELDCVGDFFASTAKSSSKFATGTEKLVSFDILDLIMSLAQKSEVKYLYHQQEAMWNAIFSEYLGRDTMNQLIEGNIIKGFIEL